MKQRLLLSTLLITTAVFVVKLEPKLLNSAFAAA